MDKKVRKQAAIRYFNDSDDIIGRWLMGIMSSGFDAEDDGRCDIQSEDPETCGHAKELTLKEYADVHREALVRWLQTPSGKREFQHTVKSSYDAVTAIRESEDEEDDDG